LSVWIFCVIFEVYFWNCLRNYCYLLALHCWALIFRHKIIKLLNSSVISLFRHSKIRQILLCFSNRFILKFYSWRRLKIKIDHTSIILTSNFSRINIVNNFLFWQFSHFRNDLAFAILLAIAISFHYIKYWFEIVRNGNMIKLRIFSNLFSGCWESQFFLLLAEILINSERIQTLFCCILVNYFEDVPNHFILTQLLFIRQGIIDPLNIVRTIKIVFTEIRVQPNFNSSLSINSNHILIGSKISNNPKYFLKPLQRSHQHIQILRFRNILNITNPQWNMLDTNFGNLPRATKLAIFFNINIAGID